MSSASNLFCGQCGTRRSSPQERFCRGCGAPLDTTQGVPTTSYGSQSTIPAPGLSGQFVQQPSTTIPVGYQRTNPRNRNMLIAILSLLVVILVVALVAVIFTSRITPPGPSNVTQPPSSILTATPTPIPTATPTPISVPVLNSSPTSISWVSSHTDTSGGKPDLVISGPVVLEGDDEVNGVFQGDSITKEGTIVVLLDSTQYRIRSDNQGTKYKPTGGTPTRAQIDGEVGTIANDMKNSKYACDGGCTSIKVVYFQNGQAVETKTL